jgi:hypothetical protein
MDALPKGRREVAGSEINRERLKEAVSLYVENESESLIIELKYRRSVLGINNLEKYFDNLSRNLKAGIMSQAYRELKGVVTDNRIDQETIRKYVLFSWMNQEREMSAALILIFFMETNKTHLLKKDFYKDEKFREAYFKWASIWLKKYSALLRQPAKSAKGER